jgi:hypothetical protein
MKLAGPVHYKLRDYADSDGVIVKVDKWLPVAETPCGYWLIPQRCDYYLYPDGSVRPIYESAYRSTRKWSPKLYPRAFNPDLKLAALSFRNRKAVQLRKLEWQLQQARQVNQYLAALEDSSVTEDGFNCGTPEEWIGLRWE